MSNSNFPRMLNSVRFIKKNGNKYYLNAQNEGITSEVDAELFDFALHLDGCTDPALIEGVSESAGLEALQILKKWDLIEYPNISTRRAEYTGDTQRLLNQKKNSDFIRQFLLHPNMLSLICVAIIAYNYFSRQTIYFFLTAVLMLFSLVSLTVIDIRHKTRK